MKKRSIIKALALFALSAVLTVSANAKGASGVITTLPVENASLTRNGNLMTVDMHLDFAAMELKGDKAVLYTPYIVNGTDSLALPSIGFYSRNRWYQYQRKGQMALGGADETPYRYSERPATQEYVQHVNYQPWMNGAHIAVKSETYGCCRDMLDSDLLDLGTGYREFHPTFLYQTVEEVAANDMAKTREISGRAYVDFPVNQIVIYPDYRNNTKELGKIIATIDSVKADPDVTVNSIFIKGTASPEGPYDNNVRLAKGRTEALKEYVKNLYKFPDGFIQTDFEPVDWDGLREYLATCGLEHRDQILDIVNSDMEPYARNQKIKTTYPSEYKFLLDNIYPTLRHSDYRIEYTIRQFTEVAEIAALLHTNPGKLSLNEMMFLAQSYEVGSEEYNDVFEVAVRMFPNEPAANLNVATSAMERGDLVTAEKFLPKAGITPEAVYARANLAFLKGDYEDAKRMYREAALHLPQAAKAYEEFLQAGY